MYMTDIVNACNVFSMDGCTFTTFSNYFILQDKQQGNKQRLIVHITHARKELRVISGTRTQNASQISNNAKKKGYFSNTTTLNSR